VNVFYKSINLTMEIIVRD